MKTKLLLLFALLSSVFGFAQSVTFTPPYSYNVTATTASIATTITTNNYITVTYKITDVYANFPYVSKLGSTNYGAGTYNHSSNITGLVPDKLYYYEYTALNVQNNTISSGVGQFTTLSSPPQISAITSVPSATTAKINYTVQSMVNTGSTSLIRYGVSGSNYTNVQPGFSIANKATIASNITLEGLLPNTQYNYQIESTNSLGTTISLPYTFSTTLPAIKFENLTSSAVTNSMATLSVDLANVCVGANYHLQYSKTANYTYPTIDELKSSGGTAGTKNHDLTGLSPNTKYYYRFYSAPNEACNNVTIYSEEGTFITSGPVAKPIISAVTIAPAATSAIVNYSLNANNDATISVVKYGLAANTLTNTVTGFSATGNVIKTGTALISGLTLNTVYYYQIEATNTAGTTTLGAVGTFTTGFFTNLQATAITETTATIGFTINYNCYNPWYFLYYSTSPNFANSGYSVFYSSGTKIANLTGLLPGTTYYYRMEASPASSTQSNQSCFPIARFSETASFTTVAYTVPIFTQVAPICVGGTLADLPLTSTNNITGTWSPALNNMQTTTYTFTPTAGQLAATTTMIITVNTPTITPTFAAIPAICINSATIPLPTTSTNGIVGTWSPALNNQVTTNYTFTPNSGQCAVMISATIPVSQQITPSFNSINQICIGDVISPLPTTSTNGIEGTWSPVLNNLQTTIYSFTPTAGQACTPTTLTTLTITVDTGRIPVFTPRTPICSGGAMAALPTSSNNGVPGAWSPALNNTTTTEYTFTPSEFPGLCSSKVLTKMTIVVNATPDVPTGNPTQQLPSGATLASLMVTPANVIWYGSSANATSGINALPTTTSLVSGSTYYAVNVLGNCRSAAFAVTVSPDLSNESFTNLEVSLYPNPVHDVLNIEMINEIMSIELYNIQGQKVLSSNKKQVNIGKLASGLYIVKVKDVNNAIATKKLMKQ